MDALQHTSPSTPTVSRLETTQLNDDGAFTCGMAPNSPGFFVLAAKNRVAAISIDLIDFPNLDPSDTCTISSVLLRTTTARYGTPFCVPLVCSHATGEIASESTPRALASRTFVALETEEIPPYFFLLDTYQVDAVFAHRRSSLGHLPPVPIFGPLRPFRLEKFRMFQET